MYAPEELATLDGLLQDGALMLVPNFRASRQWQEALARRRMADGAATLQPTPRVQAVDLWLADLWRQFALHADDERLSLSILSPAQESMLWQHVIEQAQADILPINLAGTAEAAREAWQRMLQWQLPAWTQRRLAPEELSDPEVFGDWAARFRDLCRNDGVISFSAMLVCLLDLANDLPDLFRTSLPPRIILHGFTSPPPLYERLFAQLRSTGIAVENSPAPATSPQRMIYECPEPADELLAAARWATDILARDPQACIGVVSPNLQSVAPTVERSSARYWT